LHSIEVFKNLKGLDIQILLLCQPQDLEVMNINFNKKLSSCWQTHMTCLEVSQGHQPWYHLIC